MTATPALVRSLEAGQPVTWWQLGMTDETRYDVPDSPMAGEMDPFFFVTKHKNFIPHEYPCRTQFRAERRDRRPLVTGAFTAARNWLPFDAPRVDLSGFWFRPTVLGTWARAVIAVETAGPARLRLATCGGAILSVNGAEVGWMAPYGRNLETDAQFDVMLSAGDNEILIWFDDLAERDARYYFQLDYVSGPKAVTKLAAGARVEVAEAIVAALSTMHFEKPAYTGGEVALAFAAPIPADVAAAIHVEGDFMSTERVGLARAIARGARRLSVVQADEVPADFRHFSVTLAAEGFAGTRVFGVEISQADAQGTPSAILSDRISEALDWIAERGEPDTVTSIARLATGRTGAETEAMIAEMLPAIEDCHDCADFILVPLLWSRTRFADRLSADILARIDHAILGYRYWMDEPGNDVQWYFSENHALLFHTAAYLAGLLLPGETFRRSGRTGVAQSAAGAARVRAWLDHFEDWEMAEFNSAPYFPIDLKGLTALYALAPDKDISQRAGRAILRLLDVVAASAHHGVLTAAQGRSYEHTLRAGRTLELSGMARMLWGLGALGRRFHALPQLALCLRDHGLAVSDELAGIASLKPGIAREWCFAQGQNGFARMYHHKTADHAMGSVAAYRWDQWGYQETVLHLRLGTNPDAQIWINQPGELIHSGYARPSYWGGCATVPRVHQYRDLAILVFNGAPSQPALSHAWFPQSTFDAARVGDGRALARGGDGLALVKGGAPLMLVGEGPTVGNELRQDGLATSWIVRLGSTGRHGTLEAFGERFAGLAIATGADGVLMIEDPDYGSVRCHADGVIEAEGRRIDPADWTVPGHASLLPDGPISGQ